MQITNFDNENTKPGDVYIFYYKPLVKVWGLEYLIGKITALTNKSLKVEQVYYDQQGFLRVVCKVL